ncbi:hypothetical protein PAXRUDRAFT_826147 [Paxillus rubicundulus Ve08.2h10]|uniref:Uncharacterized protein n=1 Tax=Paxillus rubicundulus Ve08.2h10 TaxID=930991 RepID=A0A0D0DF58_9AGAM|nr:hypothetical protein PAXRUDRAFT_826147 [Paxillus rubicundulus Ve08.2h10]
MDHVHPENLHGLLSRARQQFYKEINTFQPWYMVPKIQMQEKSGQQEPSSSRP